MVCADREDDEQRGGVSWWRDECKIIWKINTKLHRLLVKLLEVLLEILCVPLNAIYVLPFIRIQIQRTFQIVYFLKSKSKNIFDVFVNRVNILQTLNVRNFDWFFLSYKLYLFIFSINRASVKTIWSPCKQIILDLSFLFLFYSYEYELYMNHL